MPWSITEIHPLFVHFPIALFATGLFFDLLAETLQKEELEQAGFWCMLMGLVSCLFANMTGLLAFLEEGSLSDLLQFFFLKYFCKEIKKQSRRKKRNRKMN